MDYEQKYNDALERARESMKDGGISQNTIDYLCNIFPELKESEDEKIRKGLIENFKWFCGDFPETTKWGKDDDMLVKDIITWLEKQGKKTQQTPQWMINFLNENRAKFASSMDYDEQIEAGGKLDAIIDWLEKQGSLKDIIDRYKDSWYNEGKIAGMAEGLTDDEKYQQGWHDALEKQGEQKAVISDDALKEGITHFGITQYQIDNWLKKYIIGVEKQCEKGGEE